MNHGGTRRETPGTMGPRMLRVEFKGQPYDWFNLDDMGEVVSGEDFHNTVRENIAHYFSVAIENQVVMDEEGPLVTSSDYARALQHVRPCLHVYDLMAMPQDVKEQICQKLASTATEVARLQRSLGALSVGPGYAMEPMAPVRPVSPWPVRDQGPLADRVGFGGSATPAPPLTQPPMQHYAAAPPPHQMQQPYYGAMPTSFPGAATPTPPGMMAACMPGMRMPNHMPQNMGPAPGRPGLPSEPVAHMGNWPMSAQQEPLAPKPAYGVPQAQAPPPRSWQEQQERAFEGSLGRRIEVELYKDHSAPGMDRFGFANVPTPDGRALIVNWIDPSGLLGSRWNRTYPARAVREGDLIIGVNDISDNVEAMRAQLQYDSVRMLIQRQ